MNVANLELSKELYELSGWSGTPKRYHMTSGRIVSKPMDDPIPLRCPAYDLGYILRRLPKSSRVAKTGVDADKTEYYFCAATSYFSHWFWADTPENAACKLAIELFKQGVLNKKEDSDE